MAAATPGTSAAAIAAGNYSVDTDRSCTAASSCTSRGASTTSSTIATAAASDE
jgi:hypothetical protein